jgi:DNA-binding transcriptional regulator GbsR (MarR family)
MSINSFFNTVSVSRYSRPIAVTRDNDIQILENQMNLNPTEFIQASLNQKKRELENRRQDIHVVEGLLVRPFHLEIFLYCRLWKHF